MLFFSQFAYCPLIWMFHNRTLNKRINKVQERALRLVHNDNTSSFYELIQKDNSFTIHHWNIQKLALAMFRVKHRIAPKIMCELFNEANVPYNLRQEVSFHSYNVKTELYDTETLSYLGNKIWNVVSSDIKDCATEWMIMDLECYDMFLKFTFTPTFTFFIIIMIIIIFIYFLWILWEFTCINY